MCFLRVTSEQITGFLQSITRGKRLLVLIGQKKALGIVVRNDLPQRQYSGLLGSLRGGQAAITTAFYGTRKKTPSR
jgi:hypothetical protein